MRAIVLVATITGCAVPGCAASRANLASPVVEDDCEKDLGDALRGAAIGAAGAFLLGGMITGFDRHTAYIGVVGAVGGFLSAYEPQYCRRLPEYTG